MPPSVKTYLAAIQSPFLLPPDAALTEGWWLREADGWWRNIVSGPLVLKHDAIPEGGALVFIGFMDGN